MANELTQEEWEEIMQNRLEQIIDNSNNLYDIFEVQGDKDKVISKIHSKTEYFADATRDEVLFVAETLSNLIYATPLNDDYFYIHSNEQNNNQREMLFFSSYNELNEYREKNNNCIFLCLRFRDIITLKDYFGLDLITLFLTDYVLNFSKENIESFYEIYAYENTNSSSNYIIGQPTESYKNAIEILTPKFQKYDELENIWLYHVLELKNKTSRIVDNKYEEMYDVFVLKMREANYINIRVMQNDLNKMIICFLNNFVYHISNIDIVSFTHF